jgi:hypothetical protein
MINQLIYYLAIVVKTFPVDLLYGKLSRFLAHIIDDDNDNIHSYLIFVFRCIHRQISHLFE